jgi:hypothetical protein
MIGSDQEVLGVTLHVEKIVDSFESSCYARSNE